MAIPSIKTLRNITSYPAELRRVLECDSREQLEKWATIEMPFGKRSKVDGLNIDLQQYFNRPTVSHLKLLLANKLCETHGVEYVSAGSNKKSPSFYYLNAGDTYAVTLIYFIMKAQYSVGCFGDIVERGNYL